MPERVSNSASTHRLSPSAFYPMLKEPNAKSQMQDLCPRTEVAPYSTHLCRAMRSTIIKKRAKAYAKLRRRTNKALEGG